MPTLGTFGAAAARGFGLTTAGRFVANITISSNTANYTFNTAKVAGYIAGKTAAILTINSGVTVSSASTGSYAFTVDTSWAVGDTVTIINNGIIVGRGGNGGTGAGSGNGVAGASAGPALLVQRAITLDNLNRIAGGGGGGGGGGNLNFAVGKGSYLAGGGGGGGGIGVSSGGAEGNLSPRGSAGAAGTLTSAGNGGNGGNNSGLLGGSGGNGGGYGSAGSTGVSAGGSSPGSGGAAGACIVGNSNITYTNTGTRNGSIS
jgi:hypothetical protein